VKPVIGIAPSWACIWVIMPVMNVLPIVFAAIADMLLLIVPIMLR